ncbi:MAG: inositol monophosphatase [Armatimonadetes bacterium]|nr:inositol monophosphatase [Armatimonadota bacterium]
MEPELEMAQQAAREAGALLLRLRQGELAVRSKADRTLVTEADLAAEQLLLDRIRAAFPQDGVLAEESGESGAGAPRTWIVDPLDGTTNFAQGLPYFAVSLALWEGDDPALGVVYLPVLDELFTATRVGPARLNGREIHVSDRDSVSEAMVNVYFDRRNLLEPGLALFCRIARACEGRVKTLGSTASLLCYVAAGRLDAYLRNRTRRWDFAAGGLILERAGGRLSDFAGAPLRESGQSLLATNGRLHAALRSLAGEEGENGCL